MLAPVGPCGGGAGIQPPATDRLRQRLSTLIVPASDSGRVAGCWQPKLRYSAHRHCTPKADSAYCSLRSTWLSPLRGLQNGRRALDGRFYALPYHAVRYCWVRMPDGEAPLGAPGFSRLQSVGNGRIPDEVTIVFQHGTAPGAAGSKFHLTVLPCVGRGVAGLLAR